MDYEELKEEYEQISLQDEEGNEFNYFIIDSIRLREVDYLLAIEADEDINYDEDVLTYIFKLNEIPDSDEVDLEILDQGLEYDEIFKIFEENEEE